MLAWCFARMGCDAAAWGGVRTAPVVPQVGELVGPLRNYTQRVLEEGDDNEEASNGREVAKGDVVLAVVDLSWAATTAELGPAGQNSREDSTHGLMGSLTLSSTSSTLSV